MKKCTGKIYKINGKTFCVGEKRIKSKKNARMKLKKNKTKIKKSN
jgi:hypothetical protein